MDRFDDIWKDRFNEEELPLGDWNTPDDEVWKGIIPHVTPKKEKKRRWWWLWFGVGGLLILTITVLSLPSHKKTEISKNLKQSEFTGTLAATTFDSNVVNTGVNVLDESKTITNTSNSEIESEIMSVNVSPSKTIKESELNNTFANSKKQTKIKEGNSTPISKSIIADTKAAIKLNSPESSSFNFLKTNKALEISLDGKNVVREHVSISKLPSLENLLTKRILPTHDLSDLKLVDIPSERKIGFGFSTGAVFWKHRVSNNYTDLLQPFDFNYENGLGWQAALDMKIDIKNHFEAIIGFQYEQINTTSGHNSEITYNLADEVDSSNPLNGYVLSLATPYGLSGATFNFIRNQNIGANSADLLVDFHSIHVIKNISIPVGLNIFPFGKMNIWVPSVHVGFGTNYLASISNKIQSIDTHHDAIQYDDSGTSTFVSPELEKWHFDYRLGLGVTHQINTRSSLRINYDWSRGINPIFKLDDYNTRIDRHHISLGLTTKLHKP